MFESHRSDETSVLLSKYREKMQARPLSVAVPSLGCRTQDRDYCCHVLGKKDLWSAFVSFEPTTGLYCSNPELVFLQLAQILPVKALVVVGCELCGTYALTLDEGKGFANRSSLTTKAKLLAFLEEASGCRGVAVAKKAVPLIVENSASPMETYLVLRLTLPRRLGGFGLPQPIMNHKLKVSSVGDGPQHYVCDLYWVRSKLAIEYDSTAFHTNEENVAYDSRRRVLLSELGVTVLSATRDQTLDEGKLTELARIAGKHLGVSVRCRSKKFLERRAVLAKSLYRAISYPAKMPKGGYEDVEAVESKPKDSSSSQDRADAQPDA